MGFVLITSNGQRFYFYIRECAEIYKFIYGGEVFVINKHTKMIIWKSDQIEHKYGWNNFFTKIKMKYLIYKIHTWWLNRKIKKQKKFIY